MNFFKQCSDHITNLSFSEDYIKYQKYFNQFNKFIFLGNGGSNAIAAHISQDFIRTSNKKSVTFSDPSMLTCFINDYGQENAYRKFLETYYDSSSFVILISSSGESKNIINCVNFLLERSAEFGVLTGFCPNNTVREASKYAAKFNYYVDSDNYGVVECVHQVFLHGVIK